MIPPRSKVARSVLGHITTKDLTWIAYLVSGHFMQTVNSAKYGPSRSLNRCAYFGIFILTAWICFGPVFGFNHTIMFGVTGYLFLDDDLPPAYVPHIGSTGVVFHSSRFAISVVLWMFLFSVLRWFWRLLSGRYSR